MHLRADKTRCRLRTLSLTSARATAALLGHLPVSLPSRRVWAKAARTQARTLFGVLVLVDRTSPNKPCRGEKWKGRKDNYFGHDTAILSFPISRTLMVKEVGSEKLQ